MNSLLARLLMVIAVALVPAVAFQAYTEYQAREVRQQLVREEALRLVQLVGADQQRIIEGADQVLDALRSSPAIQDNVQAICQRYLSNLLQQSSRYLSFSVIGLDGKIVCEANPERVGADVSDRPYFIAALKQDRLVTGEYAVGRTSGQPSFHIAKRYYDRNGTPAGVVMVALSLKWLGDKLEHLPLPPGAVAKISDRDGLVLARSVDGEKYLGKAGPADSHFTLQGDSPGVRDGHGMDGRSMIIAYAPPDTLVSGMMIGVGLDPTVTFAKVSAADRTGLMLILSGCGLALILTAIVGTRLIRRPVSQLLETAAKWRAGALAARTSLPKDRSEFGRLAFAFDEMAEALEGRERALRTALESTTDYVVVVDSRWLISYGNQNFRIYLDRGELIGVNFWDVFPHLRDTDVDQCCRVAMHDRRPAKAETQCARHGRHFEFSAYPSEAGVTVFVRDVTEERRTAAALRESEARLQLAREAAGFGIWDRDIVAGTTVWSEQNWLLYGQTPRAGGPSIAEWRNWLHPEDQAGVVASHDAALGDGSHRLDLEYRIVCADGTVRWLLHKGTILRDSAGKPIRIVGLNMDVTASRETEATLRRLSNDLERRVLEEVAARVAAQTRAAQAERMQALGQLAGGIAHDFNNVLQAVQGAMALIERRASQDAKIQRLAKLAGEATERGASITRRLLTFGRRGDLSVENLDVADLLRGLHEVLRHTLGAAVDVQIRLAPDLPPILADRRQLETAMVNLATNARDAMPTGGQLVLAADVEVVRPGDEHPAALAPGAYVRFTALDNGTGMDAATLARAREPFFTTKQLGVGTGLGLPMAQGFAEQSGGALAISSQPGEGTTVIIWLPQAEHGCEIAETELPKEHAVTEPGSRGRVLVVDDEVMIRDVLTIYLEESGYRVTTAANGADALSLLDTEPPFHALITDLSMPGMDGLTVIRGVQKRYPSIPAILLTGFAGDDAALALGTSIAGSVSLLRKPVTDTQLLDRLHAMLAACRQEDAPPVFSGAK